MISELDLVAQAMAPQPTPLSSQPLSDPSPHIINPHSSLPPDILASLENLSPEDRAALEPLLTALSADPSASSAEDLADLLGQFDAAEGVADNLESKLDNLLSSLSSAENELNQQEAASGGPEGLGEEEKRAFGASEEEVALAGEKIEAAAGGKEGEEK